MQVIKPPNKIKLYRDEPAIFLAGSIEQGIAANWQFEVETRYSPVDEGVLLNPRREHWDATWVQSIDNPEFAEQVEWELDALDRADVVMMYFDPNTKSPITLLELGLYAASGKLIVVCPDGYWRKGNVDVVCRRYGVMQADSIKTMCKVALDKCNIVISNQKASIFPPNAELKVVSWPKL